MQLPLKLLIIIIMLALHPIVFAKIIRYGEATCKDYGYYCLKVKRGDTWEKLWPDPYQRDILKRLNRMNIPLHRGLTLAVPEDLEYKTVWDVSPMPFFIEPTDRKTMIFNQKKLAWGAYDSNGNLVKWGPASGGRAYCPDVDEECRTVVGKYSFYHKRDGGCFSRKFPINKGGAPMPFCMFFHGGYAFHGSPVVPGYHASHGCVRLYDEDAEWLNTEFIDIPGRGRKATRVIVQPL